MGFLTFLRGSLVAGTLAAFCALPFDNAKTKIQKMKAGPNGVMPYKNIFDALVKVTFYLLIYWVLIALLDCNQRRSHRIVGWYEHFLLQMRRTYCLGVADSRFPYNPGQEEKIAHGPLREKKKAYLY